MSTDALVRLGQGLAVAMLMVSLGSLWLGTVVTAIMATFVAPWLALS